MNRICKRLGAVGSAAALAATLAVPAPSPRRNTAGIAVQLDGQNVMPSPTPPCGQERTHLPAASGPVL